MKLNADCVRQVMLTIESFGLTDPANTLTIFDKLPDFSEEDVIYACYKLKESSLINFVKTPVIGWPYGSYQQFKNAELTAQGHDFLTQIANDTVWNRIKQKLKQFASISIPIIIEAATSTVLK